jgi:mTERF domain-containing protein, mitochondrial
MMLRLQSRLVSTLRAGNASSLVRRILLCTDTSPAQSVSESDLKVSRSIPSLTTPDRADVVHAFLAANLGLSKSYVASIVSRTARIFCVEVDKALAPCVSQLRDIGLSSPEICRLLPLVPSIFVSAKHVSLLAFYMSLLGSFEKVHISIRRNKSLLCSRIEHVEPNIALLRQCGLTVRDIARVLVLVPRLLAGSQKRLEGVILRAEELGVPGARHYSGTPFSWRTLSGGTPPTPKWS